MHFFPFPKMSKVHPQAVAAAAASTLSPNQEIRFTIWMKSLVLDGFGCTVFDSSGQIVYRVDNYSHKCSKRVFLMDTLGKVLFTIVLKKKCLRMFGCWEIYSHDDLAMEKPGFHVRRIGGDSLVMGFGKKQPHEYKMAPTSLGNYESSSSSCNIFDKSGVLVAEVIYEHGWMQLKRKRSTSGVDLGKDVLALEMVEPSNITIDQYSCIMALIVVYGCTTANCK